MDSNDFEIIKSTIISRKSIRSFLDQKIERDKIKEILECGRWAPSGLNNQPWKICAVSHPTVKRLIMDLTKYGRIMEKASFNLVVFLDVERGYNRVKDIQGIGAFMQNILIAVHGMGLGAVWIGEILNNKEKINEIFKLDVKKFELMGMIAIGVIDKEKVEKQDATRERRTIDDFIDWY